MLSDLNSKNAQVSEAKTDIEMLQKAWEIEWKQLKIIKKIAEGGEGSVFRAAMRGLDCAVKTIANTQNISIAAQSEVKWMQRARHERLVMFFGCGRDETGNIFVVLEFMAEGDLLTKMVESRERNKPMPWKLRLQLLHDVVDGMAYVRGVRARSARILIIEFFTYHKNITFTTRRYITLLFLYYKKITRTPPL